MAREPRKVIALDAYEEGAVIKGLNILRTQMLEQGKSVDFVSDVMLKILQTPVKNGNRRHEAR